VTGTDWCYVVEVMLLVTDWCCVVCSGGYVTGDRLLLCSV
jgi:hypothetical protein